MHAITLGANQRTEGKQAKLKLLRVSAKSTLRQIRKKVNLHRFWAELKIYPNTVSVTTQQEN